MEGHVGQLRRLLVGLGLVKLEEVEERERAAALAAAAALEKKKAKEAVAVPAGPSASGPPSSSSETEASSSSSTTEDAASFADFPLPPQPFHIVGHSMGGCISMGYADQYPDDIASITLLTPAGLMEKGTFKLLRSLPCCIQDIVKRCLRRNTLNAVRNDFVQHYTELENRIVGQVKEMHTHNPHAFDAIFRSILAFPLSGLEGLVSNVAAARPPILLVWAKWDRVVCLDPHFFRWKALLKTPMNVKYEVVDDAGHAFLLEKAEKTNGIVLRFLKNPPTWMPPALINQLSQHPPTITI
jgi:pimeloyl-ACP methyl ester carboxylesterase